MYTHTHTHTCKYLKAFVSTDWRFTHEQTGAVGFFLSVDLRADDKHMLPPVPRCLGGHLGMCAERSGCERVGVLRVGEREWEEQGWHMPNFPQCWQLIQTVAPSSAALLDGCLVIEHCPPPFVTHLLQWYHFWNGNRTRVQLLRLFTTNRPWLCL